MKIISTKFHLVAEDCSWIDSIDIVRHALDYTKTMKTIDYYIY